MIIVEQSLRNYLVNLNDLDLGFAMARLAELAKKNCLDLNCPPKKVALSSLFIHLGGLSKHIPFCQPIENCIFVSKSPFLVCFGHLGYRSKSVAIRHNLTEPRQFSQSKCRKLAAETQFWVKNTKRLDRAVR